MWNDMLHGAAHGRPVIRTPGEPNFDKAWFKEQLDHSYGLRLKQQEVEWPPEWRKVGPAALTTASTIYTLF